MPNILKRPMFRKGGSTAYGTGITANLEPRKNYEAGTGYEEIINRQYQSMLPSDEQLLKNLITGFGASAPQDPMQLQTWGTAFSSAGKTAAALRAKQEVPAMEYKKQAGIQAIKNLTAPEKDQIFRFAKERARILGIPENMRSRVEKNKLIFLDNELKKSEQYLREASPKAKKEALARKIEAGEGNKLKVKSAINMADTQIKMEEGKIIDPRDNTPLRNYSARSLRPNEIIPQGDGSIAIANPDKTVQQALKTALSPNTIYITQQEGYLYLYEGNNKFRRIYP